MLIRLLVCGDRNWVDGDMILDKLKELQKQYTIEVVIEGTARGADTLAGLCADTLGIKVLRFPAQWDLHGKAAGPIRNRQMLNEGKPNLVWAFHDNIANSKGTRDMVGISIKAGIETIVFRHEEIKHG